MKSGLPSAGHGEIRQTHVWLLPAFRLTPSADRRLSPVEAFETGGLDPGRYCAVGIARGHAGHPPIGTDARWADDKNFVRPKLLSVADHPGCIGGGLIGLVESVQIIGSGILEGVAQMPDTGKPFCGLEHPFAITLAGSLIMAPMHPDRLLIISLDRGNPHPDRGMASRGIPVFDLVCQRLAIGREANVLAPGFRLAEIKKVLMNPN